MARVLRKIDTAENGRWRLHDARSCSWRERGGPRVRDVLGIGQGSVDHVVVLDRLPNSGEKVEARDSRVLPGGQIATATLACTRLTFPSSSSDGSTLGFALKNERLGCWAT